MSELAKGCSHFLDYRKAHGLQSFSIIYKYLVKPSAEARKLKVGTTGKQTENYNWPVRRERERECVSDRPFFFRVCIYRGR